MDKEEPTLDESAIQNLRQEAIKLRLIGRAMDFIGGLGCAGLAAVGLDVVSGHKIVEFVGVQSSDWYGVADVALGLGSVVAMGTGIKWSSIWHSEAGVREASVGAAIVGRNVPARVIQD